MKTIPSKSTFFPRSMESSRYETLEKSVDNDVGAGDSSKKRSKRIGSRQFRIQTKYLEFVYCTLLNGPMGPLNVLLHSFTNFTLSSLYLHSRVIVSAANSSSVTHALSWMAVFCTFIIFLN